MVSTVPRPTRAPKARDPLSQLLASGALRAVVLYFVTHEEATPTVRELIRATGLGPASLIAEVDRLASLGILERRAAGRAVHLAVDVRHSMWVALRGLVRAAAPAPDVLRAALADLPGIDDAFVFGSTAAGAARPDSDVDVIIVGTPAERLLARRTLDASALLGRDVNPIVLSRAEWAAKRAAGRAFWTEVARGPKVWLVRHGVPVRQGTARHARRAVA